MNLRRPSARFLRERPRLLQGHFRGERLNCDRGGIQGHMRVCELVIAIVAAQLLAPGLAPGERRGPVQVDVGASTAPGVGISSTGNPRTIA